MGTRVLEVAIGDDDDGETPGDRGEEPHGRILRLRGRAIGATVPLLQKRPWRALPPVCPVYRTRRRASSGMDPRRLRRGAQARHDLPLKYGAPVGILPGRRR